MVLEGRKGGTRLDSIGPNTAGSGCLKKAAGIGGAAVRAHRAPTDLASEEKVVETGWTELASGAMAGIHGS